MTKLNKYTYIDLFAGCGGLSLGLFKSGWKGLFAIEKNEMAFETLKHNLIDKKNHFDWPSWLPRKAHDINNILREYENELLNLRGKVTLIAGGPPCQGFSIAGRRNENDERNKLVNAYIKFVGIVKPRIVFFENVRGFTSRFKKKDHAGIIYSTLLMDKLGEIGYNVHPDIINFGEYGVPQNRKRFILVGVLDGNAKVFFEELKNKKNKFLKKKGLKERATLKEVISDLERKNGEIKSKEFRTFKEGIYGKGESNYQKLLREGYDMELPDSHRFANHRRKTISKFKYIIKNCTPGKNIKQEIKDKFQIKKSCIIPLNPNDRSPTLTTLPDDYLHYSEPRILTVREYARIQSFDDWYEFKGKYTTGGTHRKIDVPRYTQVGNAIPPLFMEYAGGILKGMA